VTKRIRVLLCDDHTLFREGIKSILAGEPSIEVVGEATGGRQAIDKTARLDPDVVLMDIAMPDLGGCETTRAIRRENKRVKILVLTMYDEEELVTRCLEAGASGYLLKDAPASELVQAIHRLSRGGAYLSAGRLERLVSEYAARGHESSPERRVLTEREREVLVLLAEGRSVKEVAIYLDLSLKTVDAHKYNLMRKLGIHNKAELVRYAIAHGFVPIGRTS
jgi:DNA-binding NarL/FixJ family response regulator